MTIFENPRQLLVHNDQKLIYIYITTCKLHLVRKKPQLILKAYFTIQSHVPSFPWLSHTLLVSNFSVIKFQV